MFFWLALPITLTAQEPALRGQVLDPTGGAMIGVPVQLLSGEDTIGETLTREEGKFDLSVAPGEYTLQIIVEQFETYVEIIRVTAELQSLAITLNVAQVISVVDVQDQMNMISLDPDNNLTATILDEDFLADLPDDEEELAQALRDLAGPTAGGEEASFIIDGFSGGRLPPKDQIRQVRINNNPFTSEHSRHGRGRIEILTRAGTGAYHGSLNFDFRDESLNARNAFDTFKPPYQRRNWRTNFSGPIIPGKLSASFSGSANTNDNSNTIRAVTGDGPYSDSVVNPSQSRSFNARAQYELAENHTLNVRYSFRTNSSQNNGGGFSLPERGSDRRGDNWQIQFSETAIFSSRLVHDTRFQYSDNDSETDPRTAGPAINVLDAFNGGGADNRSRSTDKNYQFGNMLMWSGEKLTMKIGFQGDYRDNWSLSESNFNGRFTFSSLDAYERGRPTTYSVTQGDPLFQLNQFEAGLFIQNDWRVSRAFTMSFGVRYEAQSNISDYNNFDPRFGFAYQLARNTVLRGGVGMFHQRLNSGTVSSLRRLDGTRQEQIVIRNPSYPDPDRFGVIQKRPVSTRVGADDLANPYTATSSLSIEQVLPRGLVLSGTYDFVRGVHLYRSRNINAPLPGHILRPDPTKGNILHLESTGTSESHRMTIGARQRIGGWNISGNYTYNHIMNDSDGAFSLPMDNFNLASDWGRSRNPVHRFYTRVSFDLPGDVRINSTVRVEGKQPYNITTGFDDNRDTTTNDRPQGVMRNSGDGAGRFDMSLKISKNFRVFVPEPVVQASNGGGGGNMFPPQRGQKDGGGPPKASPPNARNRNRGGATLSLFANITNVLNHTNLGRYSGVSTSPFFGTANSARNPREISVGLLFRF